MQCPYAYRLWYIEGIKPFTKIKMAEGTLIHSLFADYLKGNDCIDTLESFYADPLNKRDSDIDKVISDFYYLVDNTPIKNAKEIELEVTADIVDPLTLEVCNDDKLFGYIDIVTEDGTIVDLKTVFRKPMENAVSLDMQLTFYAYCYWQNNFDIKDKFKVALLYLVRTKQPNLIYQETEKSMKDMQSIFDMLCTVTEQIKKEKFYRNTNNCYMCDYQPLCYVNIEKAEEVFGKYQATKYDIIE